MHESAGTARFWLVAFALVGIAWLALFSYASGGVRGSDQYWYVAEVRAVMAGDPRTNSLWPHFLLTDPTYIESRPFIHQGLMPYVLGSMRGLADPYSAWIAFNLLAVGLSTALIYLTLRRLDVGVRASGISAMLFLLLPITLWHASQPLIEMTICLLSATMIYIAVCPLNKFIKFCVLIALCIIGQHIVSVFQPVLIAVIGGFVWAEWRGSGTQSMRLTIFYILTGGISFLLISLKESTLGFGVMQLMMNGTNGSANMTLWLQEESLSFSLTLFVDKIFDNFAVFTTVNRNQLFLFPFTSLLIAIAFGFFRKWRVKSGVSASLIGYIVLVALGVYGVVITLHQNQARYILYILPILIVAAAWLYHGFIEHFIAHRLGILASGAASLSLLAAGTLLAITLHTESVASARDSVEFRRVMTENSLLNDANVVIECYHSRSLQLAYAVPEKIFIHIAPDRVATPLKRIAEISGAKIIFCSTDTMETIREIMPSLSIRRIASARVGSTDYEISQLD